MSLVTKFFNTLPIEIRAISITGFFTAITLGVIKFIKSSHNRIEYRWQETSPKKHIIKGNN